MVAFEFVFFKHKSRVVQADLQSRSIQRSCGFALERALQADRELHPGHLRIILTGERDLAHEGARPAADMLDAGDPACRGLDPQIDCGPVEMGLAQFQSVSSRRFLCERQEVRAVSRNQYIRQQAVAHALQRSALLWSNAVLRGFSFIFFSGLIDEC